MSEVCDLNKADEDDGDEIQAVLMFSEASSNIAVEMRDIIFKYQYLRKLNQFWSILETMEGERRRKLEDLVVLK